MKIDIVGNNCTWVKGLSSSYIINDEILIDTPQGSFKTLYNDYGFKNIKYIFLTHFHSDHFMDMHLVFEILYHDYSDRRITIIAPKGCKERLFSMFRIVEVNYLEQYVNSNIDFIDCENNKVIKLGDYKVKIFKMEHKKLDSYGFVFEDQNKTKIGFTGDTAMCNNVHKIIKRSKATFIDTASINVNNKHLSVNEVVELKNTYLDKILYPVHLTTQTRILSQEHFTVFNDGDKIIIN